MSADIRLTHDGRERRGMRGSTVSSSATASIVRSMSKLCAMEPPVVFLRSFRLDGRSTVMAPDLTEALEKGELWKSGPLAMSRLACRVSRSVIVASAGGEGGGNSSSVEPMA